jgi:hypothetical protein
MGYRGAPPSRDPYSAYAPGPAAGDRQRDGMPHDAPPPSYRAEGPYGERPETYPRSYSQHNRGGVSWAAGGYEEQYGQRRPAGRPLEDQSPASGGWAPPPYHSSGHAAGGPPEHRSSGYHGGGPGRYR